MISPANRKLTLDDPNVVAERVRALDASHMLPLNDYVAELRARHGDVPFFDPFDGGIEARILLLLETPGRSSAMIRFTSRDNPTRTARNLRKLFADAGIDRTKTAIWNAVPWNLQSQNSRVRSPNKLERRLAADEAVHLLDRLPHADIFILAGRVAQGMSERIRDLRGNAVVLECPHPSPVYVNTSPAIIEELHRVFKTAARALSND